MFTQSQLERYADVLLWGMQTSRSRKYKKNDIVLVRFNTPATALAEVLNARLLERGLNPVLRMDPTPVMEVDFYTLAAGRQLDFIPPGEDVLCRHLNGSIFLHAPEAVTHLSGVDPKKIGSPLISSLSRPASATAFSTVAYSTPWKSILDSAESPPFLPESLK